ncbi:unnamed protein product [Rhizoctonia solani]|uniref:Cytochrome P450 n=1 Tax=Rhizoctonia solani TaxID=456999 RepID=A0A8H3BKM7_9AGAM|nr:unnamed protein product [Rhizoctonia solani]
MGHSFGVMTGEEPEYVEASRQLFPLISEMWYIRPFLPALMKIGSAGFRRFIVDWVSFGPVQRLRNITETMDTTAAIIYNQKKRALANGTLESEIAAGNDIMSMLLLVSSLKLEIGPEEHIWSAAGAVKPHARRGDGTIDPMPSLRMRITLVED